MLAASVETIAGKLSTLDDESDRLAPPRPPSDDDGPHVPEPPEVLRLETPTAPSLPTESCGGVGTSLLVMSGMTTGIDDDDDDDGNGVAGADGCACCTDDAGG